MLTTLQISYKLPVTTLFGRLRARFLPATST